MAHLVHLAGLFGINENRARVALSRMVAAGEVTTDGSGRYRLAGHLLDRQARQTGSRPGRDPALGGAVADGGGDHHGPVGRRSRPGGASACARPTGRAARGGVAAPGQHRPAAGPGDEPDVGRLSAAPEGDPRALAAGCGISTGWTRGAARADGRRLAALPPTGPDDLAPGFELSAAVLRHLQADPLLPAELLPAGWPGTSLREEYDGGTASTARFSEVGSNRLNAAATGPVVQAHRVALDPKHQERPDEQSRSEQHPNDGQPFAGRVAVITGGARGQGRSHAVELARLGADIAIVRPLPRPRQRGLPAGHRGRPGRDGAAGRGRRAGGACRRWSTCGTSTPSSPSSTRRGTVLGSVDILVANAGVSTMGSICTMDAGQWSETIDTNLTGVFNAMRAVAPHMRQQRWGRIIGISSMMGRTSNPGIPAYVASKWGVIGLCKSVAFELAGFGVTVNAIAPGNVSTPMIHNDQLYGLMRPDLEHPTREDVSPGMTALHVQPVPWLEPEEITAAVVFLASDGARHITGSVIDVDAGASARFTG